MARAIALLEMTSLFAGMSGVMLVWGGLSVATWGDVAAVLAPAAALSAACVLTFYFNDLYELRTVLKFDVLIPRFVQSMGIAFMLLVGVYLVFPGIRIADEPFLSSLLIVVGLLLPLRTVAYGAMRMRPFAERVLILGSGPLVGKVVQEIEARPDCGYLISGLLDDADDPRGGSASPPRWSMARLPQVIEEARPDRIIVALAERRGRLPVETLLEARVRGIPVEDGIPMYERLAGKLAIETLVPSTLIFSNDFKKSRVELALGRGLSLMIGVVGLGTLVPVLGLVALFIKIESRGPVLFIQERVGLGGRCFRLLKFRTMHPVTHKTSEWARDNDDRVTRVGKWLRKYRLDELPQLINVLKGDMNLVGPRPHPVSNFELFSATIPYYRLRCAVRPGITGWAQIRYGYANDLEEEIEKMRYDLYYIKHTSLALDVRIMLETLKAVVTGGNPR